ncbi:hydroxyquinol 1,2-dioxygenase [Cupriavidus oxalaticus]|uniref:Hydroxyquinol 1,2-dioxygenase n=1 Tax=Cupriavidus oxalaticus TaxID=96344 RepID=A0A4V1BZE6_9BURK|nr:hydroxyquinol 1,2-dioxygenase [Cupriavidus oxalaticus]QBY55052.1 hydroxyquinol 1,2-dioxygenase [Cupriavidus oxalaticus]
MRTNLVNRLVFAVTLAASAVGAQAAGLSYAGGSAPYTAGAHSVQEARNPYIDGARTAQESRNPYTDGARTLQEPRDRYTDGARTLAGTDRSGVSVSPARTVDAYLDGSYA